MQELMPYEQAIQIVLDNVKETPVEEVFMLDALGRPVAEDLTSDIEINAFDDASMDGFALIASDVADASEDNPISLKIVDVIGAGYLYKGVLKSGEAVRIMTGAAMPDGADANAKLEDIEVTGEGLVGDTVIFKAPLASGENVRKAGEEAHVGDVVFKKGDVVNPAGVGLLASTGNCRVKVHKKPRVAVMSIGTELVDSTQVPPKGCKRDSNRYTMAAMAIDAGAEATLYPIVADDPKAIAEAYKKAVKDNDIVVSSGGACGGDFDFITQVLGELGEVKFEFINMKPGKAQTFSVAKDGTLMFGLSGNPAASATGFEILIRPAIRKAMGFRDYFRPKVKATLTEDAKTKGLRRNFLRGSLKTDENGAYVATPLAHQSSALIGTTSHSNCFIDIPAGGVKKFAGDEVDCIRIDVSEGTVM
ncbi:MAG: gephyrin-like molybdotransferase Glp [Coriobacteriales bacterium]|jgi:molybdopterin molybdotransferase